MFSLKNAVTGTISNPSNVVINRSTPSEYLMSRSLCHQNNDEVTKCFIQSPE